MKIQEGDIVQVSPDLDVFGACLATVHEVKQSGRIMAYVQSAGVSGQQYVFLNLGEYEPTNGRAVWVAQ
jgi:hypothetical protein